MNKNERNTLDLSTVKKGFANSLGARVALLIGMGLLLLIPLAMIKGLLRERQNRKAEAVQEIGSSWGGQQILVGPILSVPIVFKSEEIKSRLINGLEVFESSEKIHNDTFFALPKNYELKGVLEPEVLHRGIFEAAVYHARLKLSGDWLKPTLEETGFEDASFDWEHAVVLFQVSDPRSLLNLNVETGDGVTSKAEPLRSTLSGREWIGATVSWNENGALELHVTIEMKGSERFRFMPMGDRSTVELNSTWANPSFEGESIPLQRSVNESGFEASWQFSAFGRGLPQHWLASDKLFSENLVSFASSGVALIDPVDSYRLAERSLKYGSLFVALGFVLFFLFEVTMGVRLHGMQYLLAGAAQVLFFLMLLAFSEVIAFNSAYLVAAMASAGLISFYAISMLGNCIRSVVVVGVLGSLYLVLFVILREQDYALLAGSGLVFFALTIVMFLTRKLDWGVRTSEDAS